MLKKYSILFTLLGVITFMSCEKDFSLNGTYKRTPIIFGLIDQSDSVHMVRITRTFLGDGDNNEYAKIADSSYFDIVDAKVLEIDGNDTLRFWQLHDTLVTNKDAGIFYGPNQKMYTFYANDLNEDYNYKFDATFDEGAYDANATTSLIKGFLFTGSWLQSATNNPKMKFASNNGGYLTLFPQSKTPTGVAIKTTKLIVHYSETYLDNSTQIKTIEWTKPDDFQNIGLPKFAGEEFFRFVKANINVDDNVAKRQLISGTIKVIMVDEVVSKYIDASKPSSSVSQSKPKFTNINNASKDALGMFAARHIQSRTLPFGAGTIKEMCIGTYTNDLGFCSTDPEHVSEYWYCP